MDRTARAEKSQYDSENEVIVYNILKDLSSREALCTSVPFTAKKITGCKSERIQLVRVVFVWNQL